LVSPPPLFHLLAQLDLSFRGLVVLLLPLQRLSSLSLQLGFRSLGAAQSGFQQVLPAKPVAAVLAALGVGSGDTKMGLGHEEISIRVYFRSNTETETVRYLFVLSVCIA
jgi:hypothetical protein